MTSSENELNEKYKFEVVEAIGSKRDFYCDRKTFLTINLVFVNDYFLNMKAVNFSFRSVNADWIISLNIELSSKEAQDLTLLIIVHVTLLPWKVYLLKWICCNIVQRRFTTYRKLTESWCTTNAIDYREKNIKKNQHDFVSINLIVSSVYSSFLCVLIFEFSLTYIATEFLHWIRASHNINLCHN